MKSVNCRMYAVKWLNTIAFDLGGLDYYGVYFTRASSLEDAVEKYLHEAEGGDKVESVFLIPEGCRNRRDKWIQVA